MGLVASFGLTSLLSCIRTGVRMVACVLIPRFALRVAGGGRSNEPAAIAPVPGGPQVVGEASRAAESQGVHPGMWLGEALARCPSLRLVPADPARVAVLWEDVVRGLEGIGADVESERPGEAFFAIDGLRGIHGGEIKGVMQAARAERACPHRSQPPPTASPPTPRRSAAPACHVRYQAPALRQSSPPVHLRPSFLLFPFQCSRIA